MQYHTQNQLLKCFYDKIEPRKQFLTVYGEERKATSQYFLEQNQKKQKKKKKQEPFFYYYYFRSLGV